MLIANCADIHFRGKDLAAANEQAAAMVMECVRREIALLAIAGDIFDSPAIGDNHASTGAIAEVAIRMVRELTKHEIDVLMIPGNHDCSGAGSADALHVFDGMNKVHIIRKPEIYGEHLGPYIFCVPWDWRGNDPQALISSVNPNDYDVLLAHIQVAGARMAGSFTCEPAAGKWQISRAFLESLAVDHIALGDFHARQELVPGKGGYVGALRQLNFGEEGNPAGFEIWNSETNETEWVELDAAPRYRTHEVHSGTMPPDAPAPNEILKVRYAGCLPLGGEVAIKQLESAGIQVEQILARPERIQRAEVPAGVIESPHALIDLWAGVQNPMVSGGKLNGLHEAYDRLFADKDSLPQERL